MEKDTLLLFSMTPLDKGESVSSYVSRSLDIIDKSGLEYQISPMGTVVEGSWEEVIKVMTDCFEKMSSDCSRITVSAKFDFRKGKTGRIAGKIKSVENKLGRDLKK